MAAVWSGVGDASELEAADGVAPSDKLGALEVLLAVGLADEVAQADTRNAMANRAVARFMDRLVGIRRKRTRTSPNRRVPPAHRVGCIGIR